MCCPKGRFNGRTAMYSRHLECRVVLLYMQSQASQGGRDAWGLAHGLMDFYPLRKFRFVPFLGHELGLEILTDDTVGASMWLEFFATRFVLGKANAAFTLRNGSAMHVPSGGNTPFA